MGRGERGACGRICNPLPGGIGHHPAGTTTGMRGARCTGTVVRFSGAGNARGEAQGLRLPVEAAVQDRTLRTAPRKHGLVPGLGDQLSPWPEPQWDAERRAAPSLSLPRERGRVRVGAAPCPQGAGQTTRLSAFRFPFCLRPGWAQGKTREWRKGEGVRKNGGMENSRANKNRAVRPGALCLSAPAIAGEGDHAKRGGGGV